MATFISLGRWSGVVACQQLGITSLDGSCGAARWRCSMSILGNSTLSRSWILVLVLVFGSVERCGAGLSCAGLGGGCFAFRRKADRRRRKLIYCCSTVLYATVQY